MQTQDTLAVLDQVKGLLEQKASSVAELVQIETDLDRLQKQKEALATLLTEADAQISQRLDLLRPSAPAAPAAVIEAPSPPKTAAAAAGKTGQPRLTATTPMRPAQPVRRVVPYSERAPVTRSHAVRIGGRAVAVTQRQHELIKFLNSRSGPVTIQEAAAALKTTDYNLYSRVRCMTGEKGLVIETKIGKLLAVATKAIALDSSAGVCAASNTAVASRV